MSGEQDELKRQLIEKEAEWERERKIFKRQLEEKDHQLEENECEKQIFKRQLEEDEREKQIFKCQLEEKDHQLVEIDRQREKDRQLEEKDRQLKVMKAELRAKSLYAVLQNMDRIEEICCCGSRRTNLNPPNHEPAGFLLKKFELFDLISMIERLKRTTRRDPKLESLSSGLMIEFEVEDEKKHYRNEAEVAFFVNLALRDATKSCNALLAMIAAPNGEGSPKPVLLEVRQEMNIFSNRCDHAVVVDCTSNAPVFCVETKKNFDEQFENSRKNRSLGKSLDLLFAMRLQGHPAPLGALTCFNETYLTCIDPTIEWDVQPTLLSLEDSIAHLPGIRQPSMTPSPLKVEPAMRARVKPEMKFEADGERLIVRSSEYIDQNHLVATFVVAILNAIKGNCKPKPFQMFTLGHDIHVDCIEINTNTYQWGKITTAYNGTYQQPRFPLSILSNSTNLYLLRCIGTGSTSKVYHAITMNGYDCVVKLYVKQHNDDGTMISEEDFKRISKVHVTKEVNCYKKIYTNELKNYVWQRKLNKLDCIILPFFHPVPATERNNEIQNIKSRLELLTHHNLAFRECDQSWRHVGHFNGKLYLFDLGYLETCQNKAAAEAKASCHAIRLTSKANGDVSTNSTTSINSSLQDHPSV